MSLKKKYEINRSKGLGENEPEMMWHTTMCPETRRLVKVEPEQEEKTKEMFNLMLGENQKARKDYISKFFNFIEKVSLYLKFLLKKGFI